MNFRIKKKTNRINIKRIHCILRKNFQNLIMKKWKNYKWKYKLLKRKQKKKNQELKNQKKMIKDIQKIYHYQKDLLKMRRKKMIKIIDILIKYYLCRLNILFISV